MHAGHRIGWLGGVLVACAHGHDAPAPPEPAQPMVSGRPPPAAAVTPELPPDPDSQETEPLVFSGVELPPPPAEIQPPRMEVWPYQVVEALNAVEASRIIEGEQPFKVIACRDAPYEIRLEDSSLAENDRAEVLRTLRRAKIPPMPAPIAETLGDGCRALAHTFTWTAAGVR